MKFSHVLVFALVALVSVSFALGAEREVRSYTNDMEYVDHVEVSAQESDLPVADHAMMETGSEAPEAEHEEGAHFVMESAEDFDADVPALLETSAEDELDTEVLRAMAVEIQDAADSQINDDGEVVMMETEAETESEAEAEAEVDAEADPSGLTAAELAQEKADNKAEAAAKVAEAADAKEETAEQKEAAADVKAAAAAPGAVIQTAAAPAAGAAAGAAAPAASSDAAAAPAASAPADGAVKREVIVLPADLSAEHAATVDTNAAATKVVQGALGEVSSILRAKDDTIRSLVYNVSYLTVTVGKLANKVDLQRSYIALLRRKLHLANLKNKELHDHVEHSADTVVNIRGQLKAVEERLNAQDKTTKVLSEFLTSNQDKTPLPDFDDNLDIQGPRTVVPKAARLARRVQKKVRVANSRYRAVPGTQVFADANHPAFLPATGAPAPAWFPSQYFGNIPTIVVERQDNGQ